MSDLYVLGLRPHLRYHFSQTLFPTPLPFFRLPHSIFDSTELVAGRILETFYPTPFSCQQPVSSIQLRACGLELCLFRRILECFHRTLAFGYTIQRAVKISGSDKFLMGNGHVAILFAVGKLFLLKL